MSKDYPPYLDYPKPYKPMTNGDRIRAMTDEELVNFLLHFNWNRDVSDFVCNQCSMNNRHCGEDGEGECPISDMAAGLMWLRHIPGNE